MLGRIALVFILAVGFLSLLLSGCSGIGIKSHHSGTKSFSHQSFDELDLEIVGEPGNQVTIENTGTQKIVGFFKFRVGVEGVTHNSWKVDLAPGKEMKFRLSPIGSENHLSLDAVGESPASVKVSIKRRGIGSSANQPLEISDKEVDR
ncbi:MAG: hypothetical protein AAEJ04_02130 [Planctomycetota bacterium]